MSWHNSSFLSVNSFPLKKGKPDFHQHILSINVRSHTKTQWGAPKKTLLLGNFLAKALNINVIESARMTHMITFVRCENLSLRWLLWIALRIRTEHDFCVIIARSSRYFLEAKMESEINTDFLLTCMVTHIIYCITFVYKVFFLR